MCSESNTVLEVRFTILFCRRRYVVTMEQQLRGRGCTRAWVADTPGSGSCARAPLLLGVGKAGPIGSRRDEAVDVSCSVVVFCLQWEADNSGCWVELRGMMVRGRVNKHRLAPIGISHCHSRSSQDSFTHSISLLVIVYSS